MFFSLLKSQAPGEFERVDTMDESEVILVHSKAGLDAHYNEGKLFLALPLSPDTVESFSQHPDNVVVVNPEKFFTENEGFPLFKKKLEEWRKRPGAPVQVEVVVEYDNLQKLETVYDVLVIAAKPEHRNIATAVLKGQRTVVVGTLEDGLEVLKARRFNAVLATMYLPIDRTYATLTLDHYANAQQVPYGFAAILEFTRRGMPVAILTDVDPRHDWTSAMMETMPNPMIINGQEVLFFNNISMRWDIAFKKLMDEVEG